MPSLVRATPSTTANTGLVTLTTISQPQFDDPSTRPMVQTSISAWLKSHTNPNQPSECTNLQENSKATSPSSSKAEQVLDVSRHKDVENQSSEDSPAAPLRSARLPDNAILSSLTAETLSPFKRMISVLLPVPYSDGFFREILSDPVASSLSLVALWSDHTAAKPRVVSGIRCRLLSRSPATTVSRWKDLLHGDGDSEPPCLYISTIGTLAPFRKHGLASALLRSVIQRAVDEYGVSTVAAHVWEASGDARAWYVRMGFTEVKFEAEYYRRLSPNGAWVVERNIRPSDLLWNNNSVLSASDSRSET